MKIELFETLDYKDILAQNIEYLKELLPEYKPAQGDDIMLVIQAFSYREMVLREFFNEELKGLFLATSEGEKLDLLAETLYGIKRLEGAKPYATATFSLLKELTYDLLIPAGYELKSTDGLYSAFLQEDITINAGEISKDGVIVLDKFTESADVKTEIPVTPLPFLKIKQNDIFKNGSNPENDEDFKSRIKVSLADKSTAGSALTYESFALKADERIEQVNILSPGPGVVDVVYYSSEADNLMQTRIEETLNAEDVRPLTDKVQVKVANEINFDVDAEITIKEGVDSAVVLNNAISRLGSYRLKIGEDVSIAKIISLLMVDGVIDVQLSNPTANIEVDEYSIAILGNKNISYRISNEL